MIRANLLAKCICDDSKGHSDHGCFEEAEGIVGLLSSLSEDRGQETWSRCSLNVLLASFKCVRKSALALLDLSSLDRLGIG